MSADIAAWAAGRPWQPTEVDCVVALMLKIIDGKCRMSEGDKAAVAELYPGIQHYPGLRLAPELRTLIGRAYGSSDDALLMQVYEQRVLAETMISRPVMKAFKAQLRAEGILGHTDED